MSKNELTDTRSMRASHAANSALSCEPSVLRILRYHGCRAAQGDCSKCIEPFVIKRGRTFALMASASDHISGKYSTSYKPNDILRAILWDSPDIVAEMFTFHAVHSGPQCHDSTHGGGRTKGA